MKASRVLVGLILTLITTSARSGEVLEDWHWRNPLPQGNLLYNVGFVNGQYLAVGEMGTILTSTDGTNWIAQASGTTMELRDCAYGAGKYVVVGDYGTVLTSPDAITWTAQYPGTFYSLNAITYASNQFVCVGEQTTILTSSDGVSWINQSTGPWALRDVIYAEGVYVASGGNQANANSPGAKVLLTSTNAQTWRIQLLANDAPFYSLAYGNGTFAATSGYDNWIGTGGLWKSDDGQSWQQIPMANVPLPEPIVTYANGKWVLIARSPNYFSSAGEIWVSNDLETWSKVFTNEVSLAAVCYGGAGFVAAQAHGSFLLSSNAVEWRNSYASFGPAFLSDLAYLNEQFVGLNYQKFIFSSNGIAWSASTAPTNTGNLFNITFGEGLYVAGGEYRMVWTSTNGVDWINPATNLSIYPYTGPVRVAYGNGVFVGAAGFQGDILTSEDGLNWTVQPLVTNEFDNVYFRDLTFANGRFVAVAETTIATSVDGTNWFVLRTNLNLSAVTGGAGRFVAVGGSTLASSTDGTNWVSKFTGDSSPLSDVAFGAGWFVATTGLYYSNPTLIKQPQPYWISADGSHWSRRTFNTPQGIGPIAFGDGTFIAGTERGGLLQSDPMIMLNLKAAAFPELQISGPRHRQYQIEYCDAVTSTNGWSSLGTITATNDPALFKDLSGTNAAQRFYRAVLLP